MHRRRFLKSLAGMATTAAVSEQLISDDGVALQSIVHPKAEGSAVLYDDLDAPLAPLKAVSPGYRVNIGPGAITNTKGSGVMTRAQFVSRLQKELDVAFNKYFEAAERLVDDEKA